MREQQAREDPARTEADHDGALRKPLRRLRDGAVFHVGRARDVAVAGQALQQAIFIGNIGINGVDALDG